MTPKMKRREFITLLGGAAGLLRRLHVHVFLRDGKSLCRGVVLE